MLKEASNGKSSSHAVPAAATVASNTSRKERSVLQAKLTKLAIQIGYAGQLAELLHDGVESFSCYSEVLH